MADNILTIHVTKHFAGSEDHEHTYKVSDKEELEEVLGLIRNHYEDYEKTQRKTVEKQVWGDILKQTPFETKEEFYKWLGKMKDYDLCSQEFCFEDYARDTIKTAMRDSGLYDYDDLDEVEAAISDMKDALEKIRDLSSNV